MIICHSIGLSIKNSKKITVRLSHIGGYKW